ncbi:MAG: hypothetical protein Q3980_06880 [Turicibacter sp.]|nr:hypothetical protein [Turicibacter sp.]MDO4925371.1 hypothetical protein [Turicibacter sp.]
MNGLETIYVGQVIKNYKELCKILNIEYKKGSSKSIQLKKLEKFITYHKEGNKFIIDEIKSNDIVLMDKRKLGNTSKTSIEIGDIILHKLLTEYRGKKVSITTTELLYRMNIVTNKYKVLSQNIELYRLETRIDFKYINQFKVKIGYQLNRRIDSALRRLQNSGYILYDKKTHIKFKDKDKDFVVVLEKEMDNKNFINARLRAFKTLNDMRTKEGKATITDMSIIFMYGEFERFRKLVCEELKNYYDDECINFWDGYVITTTELAVETKVDDSRYNKNIDYVKADFYELLERNTKEMKQQELDRLHKEFQLCLEEEINNTLWGRPFHIKSKEIEMVIKNVKDMNRSLIYAD